MDAQKKRFRELLREGIGVTEAAEFAGIAPENVDEIIDQLADDRRADDIVLAELTMMRVQEQLLTIEEISANERIDPEVRLSAANSILKFALQSQRSKRVRSEKTGKRELEVKNTLWDFS